MRRSPWLTSQGVKSIQYWCRPRRFKNATLLRGTKGRFALLHALAHIELNAINLALDIALRFVAVAIAKVTDQTFHCFLHPEFTREWLQVADDEAKPFPPPSRSPFRPRRPLRRTLPAHDGLWESAIATKADPKARLAVVPMVLEARD